jgi:hypothetical protein
MFRRVSRRKMFLADDFDSFEAFALAELEAHMPSVVLTLAPRPRAPEEPPPPPPSRVSLRVAPAPSPAVAEVPAVFGALREEPPEPEPAREPAPLPAPPIRTATRRSMIAAAVVLVASFVGTSAAEILSAKVKGQEATTASAAHAASPDHARRGAPHAPAAPSAAVSAEAPASSASARPRQGPAAAHAPPPAPSSSGEVDLDPDLRSLVELTQRLPQPEPVKQSSPAPPHGHAE